MKKIIKRPLKLYSKQMEIVKAWKDPAINYISVVCGRQVGKSFTARACAVFAALTPLFNEKSVDIGFVMPVGSGADNQFKETLKTLDSLRIKNYEANRTNKQIMFANGSRISFLASEARDGLRGRTFNYLIVDEACFIEDEIYEQILIPTVSKFMRTGKSKILLLTTAKSSSGTFYKYFTIEGSSRHKSIRWTSYEVPNANIEDLNFLRSMMTDTSFRNEYLAEFVDGINSIFNMVKVRITIPIDTKAVVAALDWAFSNDYTVLSLINKNREVCGLYRWQGEDVNTVIKEISIALNKHGNPIVYSEINGVGQVPTNLLKREYKGRVEEWVTSATSKVDIITELESSLIKSTDYLTLLQDDTLIAEFNNFGKEIKGTRIRYSNMSNKTNDDCVMATAIANYKWKSHVNSSSPVITSSKVSNNTLITSQLNHNRNGNYRNR